MLTLYGTAVILAQSTSISKTLYFVLPAFNMFLASNANYKVQQLNLPLSKLGDFSASFCADYRSEIRFAITPKLSEKRLI
jgi:hypothetical protein